MKIARPAGDTALHLLLVGLVTGLFLLPPLAELDWIPDALPGVITLCTLIAGMFVVTRPTRLFWAMLGATALTAVSLGFGGWLLRAAAAGALLLLTFGLFLRVLAAGAVTRQRIEGAVALYLLIALCFANLYAAIESALPGSFAGAFADEIGFRYFSLVVQTSTGLGDIVPISAAARSLVTLQAVTGQMYIAILLAGLVSLGIAGRSR